MNIMTTDMLPISFVARFDASLNTLNSSSFKSSMTDLVRYPSFNLSNKACNVVICSSSL